MKQKNDSTGFVITLFFNHHKIIIDKEQVTENNIVGNTHYMIYFRLFYYSTYILLFATLHTEYFLLSQLQKLFIV